MPLHKIEVDDAELIAEVGRLSPAELDELPFGAIQLDERGTVLAYNKTEAKLAGRKREDVVGRNFFVDVAPCTRVKRFHGAFEVGVRRKQLNEVFDFTFHFPTGKRDVRIRMIYSDGPRPSIWIFVTAL